MIFLVAGVPGRFAERCENLLRALVAAAGSSPAFFGANCLEELGGNLLGQDEQHAVAVMRRPGGDLISSLRASGRPFMIVLESPQACVAALMADHGLGLLDAVRRVASAGAAMLPLMAAPARLVVEAGEAVDDEELARRIAAHYQLGLAAEAVKEAATAVASQPSIDSLNLSVFPLPPKRTAGLSPFDGDFKSLLPDLMAGALQPVWDGLHGGDLDAVVWHRDLFFCGDPAGPPPAVLDITGPGRCLFYGPYIHLPQGSWSCSLMLGCSKQAIGLKLVAEIFAASVLSRVSFEITDSGFCEIEFSFALPSANPAVEIRLFNAEAAFEGHIALIQATMRPLKATRIPVRNVR